MCLFLSLSHLFLARPELGPPAGKSTGGQVSGPRLSLVQRHRHPPKGTGMILTCLEILWSKEQTPGHNKDPDTHRKTPKLPEMYTNILGTHHTLSNGDTLPRQETPERHLGKEHTRHVQEPELTRRTSRGRTSRPRTNTPYIHTPSPITLNVERNSGKNRKCPQGNPRFLHPTLRRKAGWEGRLRRPGSAEALEGGGRLGNPGNCTPFRLLGISEVV